MFCDNLWWTVSTFFVGVIVGILLVCVGVWYTLSFVLCDKNKVDKPKPIATESTFQLPPVLLSKISDELCQSKESCWALNFVLYFLFRELRNAEAIRRWILRKLSLEFDELLSTTVLGKFFSNISIQNVDVGQNIPIVNWVRTTKVELHPVFKSICTLDILVDLTYEGGFQFSIQAETHLKHAAYLSVRFNGIKGQARLQFTSEPYAHWSFSFADNPDVDIAVVSQLGGKSFSHVTSIIASQLKKSVRKKHTLPMFKVRYKPFFTRVEKFAAALVPNSAMMVETKGILNVGLIEGRSLFGSNVHGQLFATLAVADFDWVAVYWDGIDSAYTVRDIACAKTAKREANLDFTLAQINDAIVVESVGTEETSYLDLQPGDEVIAVDGKRVTAVKQCIKFFHGSTSLKVVWRIRRRFTALPPSDVEALPSGSSTVPSMGNSSILSNLTVQERDESSSLNHTPTDSRRNSAASTPVSSAEKHGFRIVTQDCRISNVFQTEWVPWSSDPIFMQSFEILVNENSRYLNIALWISGSTPTATTTNDSPPTTPNKKSKKASAAAVELRTFNENQVLGTVSIPLMDIIAECSTTGMGHFVKDFFLSSPDGTAIEARELPFKDHSGFEPHMCYGKITLSFTFKCTEDINHRKESCVSVSTSGGDSIVADPNESGPPEEMQSHQFVRTHFRSASVCDYCNKKIWLKEAYICRICQMKCHKKCNERCIANTMCRGEGYYSASSANGQPNPEIITTESDTVTISNSDSYLDDSRSNEKVTDKHLTTGIHTNVRRRTLGGLIVSAVQHRSAQLRRVGSATTLLPPNANANATSRSLPPSPQASPTASRKGAYFRDQENSSGGAWSSNPFEKLDTSDLWSSEEDLDSAVEQLLQHPNEDLVSVAKETGRNVFCHLSLAERKIKLNHVLSRIQEEIDHVSAERTMLAKEEALSTGAARSTVGMQILRCEERIQALALLLLHYCAGLQYVQDLEESGLTQETKEHENPPSDVAIESCQSYIENLCGIENPKVNNE